MSNHSIHLVDTHCHLTLKAFDQDRTQVIEEASLAGVQTIVVPSIDLESCQYSVSLAKKYPPLYAAVGIHPHHAKSWTDAYKDQIIALAKSPKVVAIGEIGLDYFRDLSPRATQIEVFRSQLEIAADLNLPVIIHNRDASSDIIDILISWARELKQPPANGIGVLHAYSADIDSAYRVIDAGFYLGIAGPITYPSAGELREITKKVPLSKIMIETDAPYLPPQLYRGKRNKPAYVALVAEQLSKVLGQEYKTTARLTTENAAGLFGWENGTDESTIH